MSYEKIKIRENDLVYGRWSEKTRVHLINKETKKSFCGKKFNLSTPVYDVNFSWEDKLLNKERVKQEVSCKLCFKIYTQNEGRKIK